MNLTVQDNEILKTIELQQLRDYLQAHGWYEDRPFLDNATIWLKQDADRGEFEILLPRRQNLGDYIPRIREVIETLEIVENVSKIEILSQLFTTANNITIQGVVMQIHTPDNDSLSGEITLLGVIANKLRKIKTELFNHDYVFAMKAYQERLPVVITGDLIRGKNIFILKNPHKLTLDESWHN